MKNDHFIEIFKKKIKINKIMFFLTLQSGFLLNNKRCG